MKKSRVIIIGCGHHAKRIHVPIVSSLPNVEIVGIVDLIDSRNLVEDYLTKNRISVSTLFVEDSTDNREIV